MATEHTASTRGGHPWIFPSMLDEDFAEVGPHSREWFYARKGPHTSQLFQQFNCRQNAVRHASENPAFSQPCAIVGVWHQVQ